MHQPTNGKPAFLSFVIRPRDTITTFLKKKKKIKRKVGRQVGRLSICVPTRFKYEGKKSDRKLAKVSAASQQNATSLSSHS